MNSFNLHSENTINMHFLTYVAPQAELIMFQPRKNFLDLSNYGDSGQPGGGFDDGNIIDFPDFEIDNIL